MVGSLELYLWHQSKVTIRNQDLLVATTSRIVEFLYILRSQQRNAVLLGALYAHLTIHGYSRLSIIVDRAQIER